MPPQSTNVFTWPSLIEVIFSDDPPPHPINWTNKMRKSPYLVNAKCMTTYKCQKLSNTANQWFALEHLLCLTTVNANDVFHAVIWKVLTSLLSFLAYMVLKIKVAATRLGLEYVNLVSFLLCIMTLILKDPFFAEAMRSTIAIHEAFNFISNFILTTFSWNISWWHFSLDWRKK